MREKHALKVVGGITLVILMLNPQSILAEDLMEVYHKALDNDPQILGAKHTHAAAKESVNESFGRMLPQLGIDFSYSETDQDIIEATNVFQPTGKDEFPTKDYSLTLTQPLYNRSLSSGYKQSKADFLRAEAEFDSKKQDLILRVAERYIEVLAATDEVSLVKAEKMAVGKQLELVQGMMKSGMARKTELYDAQARYASVEADEISALSDRDDKIQALKEMTGNLSSDLATLKQDLKLIHPEPRNPENWMQASIKQNPRVILQRHALDVSRHEVRLQKSGHFPTLDLTARLNNRDSESILFSGNETETTEILLRLNVPIYQGGITNSRTRRSQQLHMKAKQDLTEMQRAVQRSARAAYHGVISAISKVGALAKSVKSQELALHSKQQGYRSGLYTSLDVLDAERDAYEAKRDYARARYDYLMNSLRLKHAVGTLNQSDLQAINIWLKSGPARHSSAVNKRLK